MHTLRSIIITTLHYMIMTILYPLSSGLQQNSRNIRPRDLHRGHSAPLGTDLVSLGRLLAPPDWSFVSERTNQHYSTIGWSYIHI